MDPKFLPEDLTKLSDSELNDLHEKIIAQGSDLGETDEVTDEQVAELEALADALDIVLAEKTRRADEAAQLSERRSAVAAKFQPEAEVEVDAEAEVADAIETEPALVASSKGLAARRPATARPSVKTNSEFMRASGHAVGVPEGHRFATSLEVADAITRKRLHMGVVPAGTREFVSIATGAKSGIEHVIGQDAVENFGVLRSLQSQAQALVASGGYIAPVTPLYDFFRLAEPQNPVENNLPVVQAPRGGIRYIQPPQYTDADGAIGGPFAPDHDYEEDPKNCYKLTSPEVQEVEVEAISQCITFDNLAYRVFPEQVQAFLEDVAVAFASKKETYFLDYIDNESTAATADFGYGLSRSILQDWTVAAVAYRKRNGMPRNARLQVFAPDWSLDAIKLDMALDSHQGLSLWQISDGEVAAALAARGLEWVGYNDAPTAASGQKFNGAQNAGALNPWPTTVVSYLFAPGTFVRLDGGTLDVGLVRDSALNRTNDVEMFMEEWIGIAKLGLESVEITSTVCVNGAGPDYVTANTCSAS